MSRFPSVQFSQPWQGGPSPGVWDLGQFNARLKTRLTSNAVKEDLTRFCVRVLVAPVSSEPSRAGGGEHRFSEALEDSQELQESLSRRVDARLQWSKSRYDSALFRERRERYGNVLRPPAGKVHAVDG
jgi:hypothetical protein